MLANLRQYRIIPLLKVKNLEVDDALRVTDALLKGGLPLLEIVFRRFTDSKAIREIAGHFPNFLIGAGNILNKDQLLRCIDAQAKFATAPGVCVETIKEAARRNITFAPGACNPSEIQTILLNGIVDFHFYPAESTGGIEHLKQVIDPFEHLPIDLVARGGITPDKVQDYLQVPQVAAVCVDWIVKNEFIENKQWDAISDAARNAIQIARG